MNSLQEKPSQKPQINNAIFYLNSYLCEAKSSPEIPVLFMSIREEEETNHLAQCGLVFVPMCLNIIYVSGGVCVPKHVQFFCIYKNASFCLTFE